MQNSWKESHNKIIIKIQITYPTFHPSICPFFIHFTIQQSPSLRWLVQIRHHKVHLFYKDLKLFLFSHKKNLGYSKSWLQQFSNFHKGIHLTLWWWFLQKHSLGFKEWHWDAQLLHLAMFLFLCIAYFKFGISCLGRLIPFYSKWCAKKKVQFKYIQITSM